MNWNQDWVLNGMLQGIKSMGARYVREDDAWFYFDIITGSQIDDEEKLRRAKDAFSQMYGKGLKIRRV